MIQWGKALSIKTRTGIFIKANIYLGLADSFRGLVYYHHGRKHGDTQAGMVLEKQLRVLHPDPQAAGREKDTGPSWLKPTLSNLSPLQGHNF